MAATWKIGPDLRAIRRSSGRLHLQVGRRRSGRETKVHANVSPRPFSFRTHTNRNKIRLRPRGGSLLLIDLPRLISLVGAFFYRYMRTFVRLGPVRRFEPSNSLPALCGEGASGQSLASGVWSGIPSRRRYRQACKMNKARGFAGATLSFDFP
jgi:hypothetical protein